MNQEDVQKRLATLYPEDGGPQFAVQFNGRTSKRVNGLYHTDTHDIEIFNLNFVRDGDLMYTAIHELAHHIMVMKHGTLGKGHPSLFWATFHDLLAVAEQKKIYQPTLPDVEQTALINEITELLKELTALEMKAGKKLHELHVSTEENGGRIEDFIDRRLRMSKTSAKLFQKVMLKLDDPIFNPDAARIIATTSARLTAEASIVNGLSLDQTKQEVKGLKKRADVLPDDERKRILISHLKNEREKVDKRVAAAAGRRLSIDAELSKLGVDEEEADDDE